MIIKTLAENGDEKTYTVKVNRDSPAPLLKDKIMENKIITTAPTLTTSSNNTSDEDGLYVSTATNSGEPTYYFRGNVTNNYVSFAGQTWRIVRINEDGTIRLIMQNGINNNETYKWSTSYNTVSKMYYSNSSIKSIVETWYDNNIGNDNSLSSKIASDGYYCEQAKVKYASNFTSGNASMEVYSDYTPNFKCDTDGNDKGILNTNIGLLTYDEYVYAGGYYGKYNNTYYLYSPSTDYLTMSPSGFSPSNSIATAWRVYDNTTNNSSMLDYHRLRPVISLKSSIQVTGSGTSSDPYVIQ